jgi:hypothetical protein
MDSTHPPTHPPTHLQHQQQQMCACDSIWCQQAIYHLASSPPRGLRPALCPPDASGFPSLPLLNGILLCFISSVNLVQLLGGYRSCSSASRRLICGDDLDQQLPRLLLQQQRRKHNEHTS